MCPLSYKTAFSLLEMPFFGVLFLKTAYIEPILRFYMKQLCSYLYLCEVGAIALRLSLITAVQIFHLEGLEMFAVLWYNGSSKKSHLGAELTARARWGE